MRRDLAELVASGLLAATLLGSTILVLAAPGEPAASPARSAAPLAASADAGVRSSVAGGSAPEYGRTLFLTKGCNGCHPVAGAPGTLGVGPELTELARVAGTRRAGMSAEAYVRESILEPQAFLVPGYGGNPVEQMPRLPVDEPELEALVRFLLAPRPPPTATPR